MDKTQAKSSEISTSKTNTNRVQKQKSDVRGKFILIRTVDNNVCFSSA